MAIKRQFLLFLMVICMLKQAQLQEISDAIDQDGGVALGKFRASLKPSAHEQSNNNINNAKQDWGFMCKGPLCGNEDDDHSNIELNKLIELDQLIGVTSQKNAPSSAPGLIVLRGTNIRPTSGMNLNSNLARLLSKMQLVQQQQQQRPSELLSNQQFAQRKRNVRQLVNSKEDKDYSFVGVASLPNSVASTTMMNNNNNKYLTNFGLANELLTPVNLASGGGQENKWQQKLRDILLGGGQQQQAVRYANEQDQQPIQLRSNSYGADQFNNNNNNLDNNNAIDVVPKAVRDKRRRCKIDPNLGVKSPASCDADAYFGAADYSMRDVWDSAGR